MEKEKITDCRQCDSYDEEFPNMCCKYYVNVGFPPVPFCQEWGS